MGAKISQSKCSGIADQLTEDSSPSGTRSDPFFLDVREARSQELDDGGAFMIEDSEGTEASIGQGASLVDDMAEQSRKLQIRFQQQRRFEDPPELDGIID
jgi:hypothetical protein